MSRIAVVLHRWALAALRIAKRVLKAVTGGLAAGTTAARVFVMRLAASVRQAAAGVRQRHAARIRREANYRTALAAGVSALLGTLTPHPVLAAVIGVLLTERLGAPPNAARSRWDEDDDRDNDPDDRDDELDGYDYPREQRPSWQPSRGTATGPLWDPVVSR